MTPSEPPVLLEAKALSCERDRRMLFDNLDLQVSAGEVLQVEGANGSGKTTLLRVLTGLTDLYQGDVLWRGDAIASVRADYNASLRYLGHAGGIAPALTAQENLHWYAALAGRSGIPGEIDDALGRIGLRGYEDVPCHTLSAGQQRRVNLARLLLLPALLWVLDEPFAAIDKAGVELLETLIQEQVGNGGAVIVTTHQDLQNIAPLRRLQLGRS